MQVSLSTFACCRLLLSDAARKQTDDHPNPIRKRFRPTARGANFQRQINLHREVTVEIISSDAIDRDRDLQPIRNQGTRRVDHEKGSIYDFFGIVTRLHYYFTTNRIYVSNKRSSWLRVPSQSSSHCPIFFLPTLFRRLFSSSALFLLPTLLFFRRHFSSTLWTQRRSFLRYCQDSPSIVL